MEQNRFGHTMIALGLIIAAAGAIYLYRDRIPFLKHLGHLPGDLNFRGAQWSIHFPIVTCIVISILMSLIFRMFR